MKKTAHLIAVDRIVGTVKIQYQLFGWLFVRLDEYFQQALADLPTHFLGRAIFKSAQRRIAGQGSIPTYGCLQYGVLAQIDMIVEVIIAYARPYTRCRRRSRKLCLHLFLIRGSSTMDATRSHRPILLSASPNSIAPASELISPPPNSASTLRFLQLVNRMVSVLLFVIAKSLCEFFLSNRILTHLKRFCFFFMKYSG